MAALGATNAQAPGTSGFITVDSSRLSYSECGRGPTIVLVHDGVLGSNTWDAAWPSLCASFHVLRYDRRGYGRSTPPKIAFSQTADLAALLSDRHIASATIVGSSGGGALAIDFALEHQEKVQRLVLLGPIVHGLPLSGHFVQRDMANLEPVRRGDVRAAATLLANDRYMLAPGHDEARRKLFDAIVANPQSRLNALTNGKFEQRPVVPAAARLGEIRVPTLILTGEYDIPDVHAHAGAIEMGIWGSEREVVRDAGHLIQLDQPSVLVDRIAGFVAQTPVVVVTPERLSGLAGTYTPFAGDQPGSFYTRDGRLIVHFAGERDLPLFASSDSTFYALSADHFMVTFHRDRQGKASGVDISIRGIAHRANVVGGGR